MRISDLKVIVTGGASGMGRTFSLELAAEGAQVVAADVNTEALQEVTDASKGAVFAVECNVADEASVANLFEMAYKHMGAVNGLVNNAGIIRDGLLIKKDRETGAISNLSMKKWQQVIDVNLTGPFLCAREFATLAARHGVAPACMVNISSISRKGNPGQTNYSAAKAGLVAMTKLWSQELSRYGIRTGAIAPGARRHADPPADARESTRRGSVGWSLSVALPTPKRCIRRSSSSLKTTSSPVAVSSSTVG